MRRSRSGGRRRSTPAARPSRRRPATSARSTPRRSSGCGTRRAPIRATPTSCTTRCSPSGFLHAGGPGRRCRRAGWICSGRPRGAAARRRDGVWIGVRAAAGAPGGAPGRADRRQPAVPASRAARVWTRDEAIVELLRGRLSITGPTTAARSAASLSIDEEAATRRCSRSSPKASCCAGRSPARPPDGRVVRPRPARAHPSLHAEPAAGRNRTGRPRPISCASCSRGST